MYVDIVLRQTKGNAKKYNSQCFVVYLQALSLVRLRLQASTPSLKLCSAFLFPVSPHFLYQAPPGAQQLTLPDFLNVAHFGHVILLGTVEVTASRLTAAVISLSITGISTRSVNGWRVTYLYIFIFLYISCVVRVEACAEVDVHPVCNIDPDDPSNISSLLALDWTQASPQSWCLKDFALANM